jgi:uncharacterized protein YjiS (DUF1127 family)
MTASTFFGHMAGHNGGLMATVVGHIGGALRALLTVVQKRYHRHIAYQELMALDDRMLLDIGLLRDDIYAVTRGDRQDPQS